MLRVFRFINSLFGTVAIGVVVVLLLVLVCEDWRQDYVVIESFSADVNSQMAGITSETIENAFVERLRSIQDSASTRQRRNSYIQVAAPAHTLDWEIVERASGFEVLVRTLRSMVTGKRTTITGAINSHGDSLFFACQLLTGGCRPTTYSLSGTTETVDSMLNYISHITLRDLEPYTLASYLYNLDRDSSLAMIQHCLSQESTSDDHLAYFLWGLILDDEDMNDKAITTYEKSIELRPDFSWSYTNMGVVLMEQKRYDSALSTFQIANKLDADDPINLINLGRVLNKLGRHNDGRRVLEYSIEIDPCYPAAYINLGVSYHMQGDTTKAHEMYRESIELDSTSALTYFNIGILYHDKGEFSDAIEYYLHAIRHDSTYSPAYSDCGVALSELGMIDSALIMYEKAATIDSTDPKPHLNWGSALFSRGDYTNAITQYEMTISLCPECSTAIIAQQRVDSAKVQLVP